jgi:two-component system cell cycle sensor histidine kinase/response regulator CckA
MSEHVEKIAERMRLSDASRESMVSDVGYFRDLAETIREAMYVVEVPSAQISYVNPAYISLFGVTLEQMNSEPQYWRRFVHPDDIAVVEQFQKQLEAGIAHPPYRIRNREGEWLWVRLRHFPRRNAEGALLRMVGLIEDITEKRAKETRASAVNESLRRIIDVLPVGILAYRDDLPVFANPVLASHLGVPVDEILHMPVRQIIDTFFREDERRAGQRRFRQAQSGRDLPPVERHLTSRQGVERIVELQTITVDLDGAPAQVTVVRDLSEQRRLEAQVAQADRMAAVGRIAAGVAHELNNPLSYVLGNLEVAREELPELLNESRILHGKTQQDPDLAPRMLRLSERLQELILVVREASEGADRVRGIMRDMKSFSRPDADDRRELVDITRPLDAAVRMAWREIQPRARLIQERHAMPMVLGVEGRLCQVFLNLLVNAAEALPEGESHAHEVRVRTLTGPAGEAVVEIGDTGPGVPMELRTHLFEPFFTTKGPSRGTGLGLSICHDIVRAHGGTIEVVSAVGEGARFRVTLPPVPVLTVGAHPESQPVRRGHVLIVDDEPHVSATLRQSLAREHDVTVLSSGREALDLILGGERFDVILCEIEMPDVNGMDLHGGLMTAARDQCDRLVFITNGSHTPVVREFLRQVPNRCLEKPFTLREVRDSVARLLH